jgi:RyR domain
MDKTSIAKVCHEANKAYSKTLGDDSQPCWEDAPEWQRSSAIKGVEFNIANPDAPASASHDSWLEVKKAEGWKYGAVKDPEKKEHPCYVPYEQLPVEQQKKDALFKSIVAVLR